MYIEIISFALFGLVLGSFCNVLIYRLPRNIPIGLSRSHCSDCNAQIKGYDNIPILSFLLLRGKCRSCRGKISFRYPLVELFVCFLWVVPLLLRQSIPLALISALFTTALLVIAIVDFEHMIIPDSMIIAIAVLSIPGFALQIPPYWLDRIIGGVAAGALFYLLAILSEKLLKKEGMGGGDIKLVAAVGLVLGWQVSALALGLGAVIALIMIALMKLFGRKLNEEKQIPFAPALTIAMAISHYFGASMMHWYLHHFIGPHH